MLTFPSSIGLNASFVLLRYCRFESYKFPPIVVSLSISSGVWTRTTLAGRPTAVVCAGMSSNTTAAAPILAYSPTVTGPMTCECADKARHFRWLDDACLYLFRFRLM